MKKVIFVLVFIALLLSVMPAAARELDYFMYFRYSECDVKIFNNKGEEVAFYKVAMPAKKPKVNITGKIGFIKKYPGWGPTKNYRAKYYRKHGVELAEYYPYGHPKNAMGDCKMFPEFYTKGVDRYIRFHGTNMPRDIGKAVTSGCIRFLNKDILNLADLFKNKFVEFIIVT